VDVVRLEAMQSFKYYVVQSHTYDLSVSKLLLGYRTQGREYRNEQSRVDYEPAD